MRFLLRHGADAKKIVLNPKMCDMILGSFAITKLLLDYGLPAAAKSTTGWPLIFYAAAIKNNEVVKLLVNYGGISYFYFHLILYTDFYKVAKEIFPHCRQHINFFFQHDGTKIFIENILQENRWKLRKPMILLLHKCGVNFNAAIKDLSNEYQNSKNYFPSDKKNSCSEMAKRINTFLKFLRQAGIS